MSTIENNAGVRFRDGRMVKGYLYDFNSNREVFHITQAQNGKEVVSGRQQRKGFCHQGINSRGGNVEVKKAILRR